LKMPIRVHAIYTRYPHVGAHSGFKELVRYVDPFVCAVRLSVASDSDADLRVPLPRLREWLRRRVRERMAWYKLSDLAAERRALSDCLLGRADIVHFLDAEHCGQYLPALLRKLGLRRVRTVATFHQPPELSDQLIDRKLVGRIDLVVLVSPAQAPYFLEFLPEERVRVILHGVDADFFRPSDAARERDGFRCITVGHWLRDWEALAAVARKLESFPDVELHVVTNRTTGLEGLANVRFHRDVDDDGLLRLYQESDVLLLPLTGATANNALLEGIACGLPVVSTDLPAIRAYLPGDEALLAKRNDVDELVEGVLRLRADVERRAAMSRSARTRAEQLSWRCMAREYEAVYAKLVARG
jgi:glycosyltransferase involved in cell wall biosynthesis